MKGEGLDAEQLACQSVPPATMSLLGLLRHLAEVKRDRRNWITQGDPLPKLYGKRDPDFNGAIAVRELLVHRIEEKASHADLLLASADQFAAGCGSSSPIAYWCRWPCLTLVVRVVNRVAGRTSIFRVRLYMSWSSTSPARSYTSDTAPLGKVRAGCDSRNLAGMVPSAKRRLPCPRVSG